MVFGDGVTGAVRWIVLRTKNVGCWRFKRWDLGGAFGFGFGFWALFQQLAFGHLDCKSYELPSFWILRIWMGICSARPGCGRVLGHEMLSKRSKKIEEDKALSLLVCR